ncbi:uncharacterized protein LOC143296358 [Babylonia areolata]|uniref:uncharacterized protein LOC143296358 n=1 Tax=Babylonia areolata TaxID=304850 RepID=UPI003FCFB295
MPQGAPFRAIMGCCHTKSLTDGQEDPPSSRPRSSSKGGPRTYLHKYSVDGSSSQTLRGLPEERPEFTEHQKKVVLDSWRVIQKDIAHVGVVMFVGLFETHPDVQDVFLPFKGQSLDELKQSAQLKSHVLRVMGTVEKCLARIDEPDKLQNLLHELGAKHVLYNARIDYIDLIGPQFIRAVKPAMGDQWTSEIEAAWADLFRLISHIMKEAMVF